MPSVLSLLRTSALALALVAPTAAMAESGFDPNSSVVLPADQLVYVNLNPAIAMAAAHGDRAVGAHGSFGRFPPEFITPFHTHSGAYHAIVLQGVMTNPFEGEEAPPEMPAGSYWYVPAQAVHATACVSKEPCQFYFYSDSGFDFTPVE